MKRRHFRRPWERGARSVAGPTRRAACRPVAESLENRRLLSIGTPDIGILDVTTRDFVNFDVLYSVSGSDSPPLEIRAYLSSDDRYDLGLDPVLPGVLEITRPEDRSSGPIHRATLTLDSRPPIEDDRRFVFVVADPDHKVEPPAAPSEANNALFAVPLFAVGQAADRTGVETNREAGPTASGPFTGAILRGTEDFERLQSVDRGAAWGDSGRFGFGYFEGEPEQWQRDEDRLVQPSVIGPLASLVHLIERDLQRLPELWGDATFRINDAYDSLGQHEVPESLHYEGRALDLDAPGFPPDGMEIARLAGLSWLAGFDFVLHEGDHIHVSERAAFATTIDQSSLQRAVLDAYRLGRIDSAPATFVLVLTIEGLDRAITQRRVLQAGAQLLLFSLEVQLWRGNLIADVGFADLLLLNAGKLIERAFVG
jgi:hypothetical protein